jgi:uncharacterized paraquat-inducible protein A
MVRIEFIRRKELLDCSYCGRLFLVPKGKSPALCPKCEQEVKSRERKKAKKKNGLRKYAKQVGNNCSEILSNMMGD